MKETPVGCWEAGSNACALCDDSTVANTDGTHGNVGVARFRCNDEPVRVITEGRVADPTLGAKAGQKGGLGMGPEEDSSSSLHNLLEAFRQEFPNCGAGEKAQ